ncbi:MAG: hypothetical protein ABI690_10800 [Chloroflexota bacterium]
MSPSKRRDDWLDESEYPDDRDIDDLGDDSPGDYDPLTIGRIPTIRMPFWTRTRIVAALILLLIVIGFLVTRMLPVLNR